MVRQSVEHRRTPTEAPAPLSGAARHLGGGSGTDLWQCGTATPSRTHPRSGRALAMPTPAFPGVRLRHPESTRASGSSAATVPGGTDRPTARRHHCRRPSLVQGLNRPSSSMLAMRSWSRHAIYRTNQACPLPNFQSRPWAAESRAARPARTGPARRAASTRPAIPARAAGSTYLPTSSRRMRAPPRTSSTRTPGPCRQGARLVRSPRRPSGALGSMRRARKSSAG